MWESTRSWPQALPPGARSTISFLAARLSSQPSPSKRPRKVEGQWFRGIFHQPESIGRKVALLFEDAAKILEASEFTKGCPVAAVALDLDRNSERLRAVCCAIFVTWQDIIATGMDEVPEAERREVAELILATLEGALLLSRTEATKDPLLRAGRTLGKILARKFQAAS